MKFFSLPSDFDKNSIDMYVELNNKTDGPYKNVYISETYGQLTSGYIHMSGRASDTLPLIEIKDLERYVDYSNKKDIKFNYTLNASCMGNYEFTDRGLNEIKLLLRDLENIGVSNLTLTTPSMIEIVKHFSPSMKIKVSAICQVDSVKKLMHYMDVGVDRVVVEPSIIREFDLLRDMIKCSDDNLEVIINDKCMRDCPYKIFHYNQTGHDNNLYAESYYFMNCGVHKSSDFQRYLNSNWIRPEDLYMYEDLGIKYYKVEGREFILNGNILKLLKCYIEGNFEGNLLDLLHIFAPYDIKYQPYIDNKSLDGYVKAFYDNEIKCKQICKSCKHCDTFIEKSFSFPEGLEEKSKEFYLKRNIFLNKIEKE